MVAQPGPGAEPVHTLYDEQGNEIPAEVNQRVQDSDDDGSDREEVEDVTVRDNRKVRKAKRAASHSTPGSKRHRKGKSPAVSTGPNTLRPGMVRQQTRRQLTSPGSGPAGGVVDAYEQQFGKSQAQEATKIPVIPKEIFAQMKESPKLAWPKLLSVFEIAKTDPRLYAKAMLKSMPTGFFNTAETSALAKLGDTEVAFDNMKDKVFARYVSYTDAETIRAKLNNIQFDVKAGRSELV